MRLRLSNSLFQRRHRHLRDGYLMLPVNGRLRVAGMRADASPLQAWRETLEFVCSVLSAASVPFFCLRPTDFRASGVAVPSTYQKRAVEALASAAAQVYAQVGPVNDPDGSRASSGPEAWVRMGARKAFRVSRNFCAPGGEMILGPEHGCVVEFWEARDGELVAPRNNRITDVLSPDGEITYVPASVLTPMAGRDDAEARYPTRTDFLLPVADEVTFPIDVVYTWVDGGDPAWRARRDAAHERVTGQALHEQAANESRYISRDELRYSLRSLALFAPWVRHIYLVTDAQVPSWLNTAHPKITVVDHKEIFGDRGVLPTFNSHAIESQLHHIEGLSEHFLYFNDDVFLGRPLAPTSFFHPNGTGKFFPSSKRVDLRDRSAADQPATAAGKNTRRLIERTFGGVPLARIKHTPHALRRSVLTEIEHQFAEESAETAAHQFRHPDDVAIPSSLYHYYSFFTGRAVEADMAYRYINLAAPDAAERLATALDQRPYDCFCINDTEFDAGAAVQQHQLVERFLRSYFPVPSPFEIGTGQ
ncbi:stealth family protein [Actinomadura gamaensis]|uniref:Stealth family protein n=1 Tax=Actinomadura gamaensis TaxID=1763541 RepID=A0ABV9TVP2_9ACTN